jgi:hypothetical protein
MTTLHASYTGDCIIGNTINHKFSTFNLSDVPVTLAGSPVISIYVGSGTTELTAGITLTVDFDGRTGMHNIAAVLTTGNGYANKTDIQMVVTTGTVNSVSAVGSVVGIGSIGGRSPWDAATTQFKNGVSFGLALSDLRSGTAQAGSTNTITLDASASSTNRTYVGCFIGAPQGIGVGQYSLCIDYDGTSKVAVLADVQATAFTSATNFSIRPGPGLAALGIIDCGTAQSASATGIVGRSAAAFDDHTLIGATLWVFGSNQGYWQRRLITENLLSGDAYTTDTFDVTPTGTIYYMIFGSAPGSTAVPPQVDVRQWIGTAVPAPTVAGYPMVILKAAPQVKKNVALANFPFVMTVAGVPTAGLTVTATRSLDGAAFAACANAASSLSAGSYKISLNATDLNADTVQLRFTAAGADDTFLTIVTTAAS